MPAADDRGRTRWQGAALAGLRGMLSTSTAVLGFIHQGGGADRRQQVAGRSTPTRQTEAGLGFGYGEHRFLDLCQGVTTCGLQADVGNIGYLVVCNYHIDDCRTLP